MAKHKTYNFFYSLRETTIPCIRITSKKKPSAKTIPLRGTWVVREFDGIIWVMPCFPEITWGRLSRMHYVGKQPA